MLLRSTLKGALAPVLIAAACAGCATVPESESTWDPSTEARIRVFHGTAAYLHLGDVCDGTQHPVIHAAAGGFSYLKPNRKIGMPATGDMPFSYGEYVVPANQALTVQMYWQAQNAGRIWEHCGPLYVTFTPEPGQNYDTFMRFEHGSCQGLAVRKLAAEIDGVAWPQPLPGLTFRRCD